MTQKPLPATVEEQGKEAPNIEVGDAEMIPGTEKGEMNNYSHSQ